MSTSSLDHLIDPIRAGDPDAFQELVELSYTGLVRFASTYVDSVDAAEELVQTVYLQIWEQRHRLAPHATFMAYLLGAVRHRALDMLRRDKREQRYTSHTSQATPEQQDQTARDPLPLPIDRLVHDDQAQALRRVVATLPERRRVVLRLRYVDRLSHAEIGQILGVSPKAAKELLARTLEFLRAALRAHLD